MSNRRDSRKDGKTAGKTAETDNANRIHLKCDLILTDKQDRVVVEIVDKAFANLREITDILNGMYGDDENTTPAEVVRDFLCGDDLWFNLHVKQPNYEWEQNLCGGIVEMLDDKYAAKAEAAFNAAGFAVRA